MPLWHNQQKGITAVAVQAAEVEKTTLDRWVKEHDVPLTVGMITADIEKTRFTWGVRSLPWLILTDRDHVIRAEGFNVSDLDQRMSEVMTKKGIGG